MNYDIFYCYVTVSCNPTIHRLIQNIFSGAECKPVNDALISLMLAKYEVYSSVLDASQLWLYSSMQGISSEIQFYGF